MLIRKIMFWTLEVHILCLNYWIAFPSCKIIHIRVNNDFSLLFSLLFLLSLIFLLRIKVYFEFVPYLPFTYAAISYMFIHALFTGFGRLDLACVLQIVVVVPMFLSCYCF